MYYLEIKEAISKLLDVPDMVAQLVNFLFYEHNVLIWSPEALQKAEDVSIG